MISISAQRARRSAVLAAGLFLALMPGRPQAAAPAAPAVPAPAAPAAPAALPPVVTAAAAEIAGARIHADVAFLADDMLEGRATGTRGFDLAAAYVAARMAALGLEPAGDTAYFQRVPMRRAVLDDARSNLTLVRGQAEQPLKLWRDVILSPDFLREAWTTDAPLVFVGYGVTAPEMGYDDYANLDVRGKVVVQFRGAPPRFPHNERAYYSNGQVKDQMAAARGAIGVVQMLKPSDQAHQPWDRTERQSHLPSFRWTDEGGAPANVQALIEVSARLSPDGIAAVFAGAPKSFGDAAADAESSIAGGFNLEPKLRSRVASRHTKAMSSNVVGLLRGSDPKLAQEAIVITAHLDHLGIGIPVDGDSIHNGAYDNASGTAMLMEVARTFTRMKVRPKRSILFAAVTGEEKGLLGSDYLARHDAPAGLDVVGDVNLDMVLALRPLTHIVAFGAEHSTLGPVVERAAALAGLTLMPDPRPSEVVFVRSDQFSYVKQGIPAIFPVSGGDGSAESVAEVTRWSETRYHAPSDDMNQPFDWDGEARFTRMAFLTAWLAADGAKAPRWNDGDFFGRKFGPRK